MYYLFLIEVKVAEVKQREKNEVYKVAIIVEKHCVTTKIMALRKARQCVKYHMGTGPGTKNCFFISIPSACAKLNFIYQ